MSGSYRSVTLNLGKETYYRMLLQQKASDYHLEKTVADFVAYITSRGRIRGWPFPDPNELSAHTNLYGIVVN